MLSLDAVDLWPEIRYAEQIRKDQLAVLSSLLDTFTSPFYDSKDPAVWDSENTPYSFVSMMVPMLCYGTPRTRIRSRFRTGLAPIVAKALRYAVNRNAVDTDLFSVLEDAIQGCLFADGWVFSRLVENLDGPDVDWLKEPDGITPRKSFKPWLPSSESIESDRVAIDPMCKSAEKSRYISHRFVVDLNDLERMADEDGEWNKEAVKALAVEAEVDAFDRPNASGAPKRKEVILRYVWVRESNTRVILGVTQDGEKKDRGTELKPPKKWDGPRWGPYTHFGIHKSGKGPYALAPLVAVWGQHKRLNDHVRAQDASSAMRKVIALVEELDTKLAETMKTARDGEIVPVSGVLREKVVPLALGGADPNRDVIIQTAMERMERILGISDARRGIVTGGASATENNIAASSVAAQVAFVQKKMHKSVTQIMRTHAYWFSRNDSVVYPLNEQIAEQIESEMFYGGMVSQASFDEMEFDIDPDSTQYVSGENRVSRVQQVVNAYSVLAPLKRQFPEVDVSGLIREVGDSLGIEDADRWYDAETADQLAALAIQQEVAGKPAEPRGETRLLGQAAGAGMPKPQQAVVGLRGGDTRGSGKAQTGMKFGNQTANGVAGASV